MKLSIQLVCQTLICLALLTGILALTVAVGQASFVTPNTVLTVIQK